MKEYRLEIIIITIILVLIIGTYMILIQNPDFAPYTAKSFDEVYEIKSDIYNLSEIKSEMTEIAQKYEEDIKLTYIRYDLEKNEKGTVRFEFYRPNPKGKNEATIIVIKVDLQTRKTIKISYEKGHGKRVTGYSNEIVNGLDEYILDYIDDNEENISVIVTNSSIDKIKKISDINNKVTTIDIETAFENNENGKKVETLNQEEIYEIFNIIDNLKFTKETCDGLPSYYIKYNSENQDGFVIYGVEVYDNEFHITSSEKGEAILSDSQKEQLENIINQNFN